MHAGEAAIDKRGSTAAATESYGFYARAHRVRQTTRTQLQPSCCAAFGLAINMDSLNNVALRPWPAPKKEELTQDDLLFKIEQLASERGHLRNITEQSLQADIDAGKHAPDDSVGGAKDEKKEQEVPSRQEQLEKVFKAGQEMYSHLE